VVYSICGSTGDRITEKRKGAFDYGY